MTPSPLKFRKASANDSLSVLCRTLNCQPCSWARISAARKIREKTGVLSAPECNPVSSSRRDLVRVDLSGRNRVFITEGSLTPRFRNAVNTFCAVFRRTASGYLKTLQTVLVETPAFRAISA